MRNGRDMWVLDRTNDSFGDLLARLVLSKVNTCRHPIGLSQHIIGNIQRAVLQNINFDSLENGNAFRRFVDQIHFFPMFDKSFIVQTIDDGDTF